MFVHKHQISNLTTCSPPPLSIFTNLFPIQLYNTFVGPCVPPKTGTTPLALALGSNPAFSANFGFKVFKGIEKVGGLDRRVYRR